jgi:hypothetical protein
MSNQGAYNNGYPARVRRFLKWLKTGKILLITDQSLLSASKKWFLSLKILNFGRLISIFTIITSILMRNTLFLAVITSFQ